MKKLFHFLCLVVAFAVPGTPTAPGQQAPDVPCRYLLVIDTSSRMSRLSEGIQRTMFDLISSGLYGQIKPGEAFGIWTFDEEVHTARVPLQVWMPELRQAMALRASRFVSNQRFRKTARMDFLMDSLKSAAATTDSLTILLISDGGEVLVGTPFDRFVNLAFGYRFEELRKEKKPFVTTLVAKRGEFMAFAVNAGDEQIAIPTKPHSLLTELKAAEQAATQHAAKLLPQQQAPVQPPPEKGPVELQTLEKALEPAVAEKPKELPAEKKSDAPGIVVSASGSPVVPKASETPTAARTSAPPAASKADEPKAAPSPAEPVAKVKPVQTRGETTPAPDRPLSATLEPPAKPPETVVASAVPAPFVQAGLAKTEPQTPGENAPTRQHDAPTEDRVPGVEKSLPRVSPGLPIVKPEAVVTVPAVSTERLTPAQPMAVQISPVVGGRTVAPSPPATELKPALQQPAPHPTQPPAETNGDAIQARSAGADQTTGASATAETTKEAVLPSNKLSAEETRPPKPAFLRAQTAVVTPAPFAWQRWSMLVTGLVLLVVAGWLVLLLFRRSRPHSRPSLISRSYDRDAK